MQQVLLGSGPLFAQDGFIGSVPFFVIGGVVIVGLIGLLLFLRNKQNSDD